VTAAPVRVNRWRQLHGRWWPSSKSASWRSGSNSLKPGCETALAREVRANPTDPEVLAEVEGHLRKEAEYIAGRAHELLESMEADERRGGLLT